ARAREVLREEPHPPGLRGRRLRQARGRSDPAVRPGARPREGRRRRAPPGDEGVPPRQSRTRAELRSAPEGREATRPRGRPEVSPPARLVSQGASADRTPLDPP